MRKHTTFAVAALAFTSALIFLAMSHLDGTIADTIHPKRGTPHAASVGSYFPMKNIEPVW
jgi:hypothetical protein